MLLPVETMPLLVNAFGRDKCGSVLEHGVRRHDDFSGTFRLRQRH